MEQQRRTQPWPRQERMHLLSLCHFLCLSFNELEKSLAFKKQSGAIFFLLSFSIFLPMLSAELDQKKNFCFKL